MGWTDDQETAITTTDRHLLVAAAAGSGKTAVLVERIIRQILIGNWDVDRLLVVTFTHAAADEMRLRIENALRERLTVEQDETLFERLERQLILLSGASISTLHSFCQTLIRQNFARLELDPEFRIGGEQELNMIKRDVLTDLFEAKYESGDEDFLRFVDAYGGTERGDEKLYYLVLTLYEFARSSPSPAAWLANLPRLYQVADGECLTDTVYWPTVKQDLLRDVAAGLAEAESVLEAVIDEDFSAYKNTIEDECALWRNLAQSVERGDWAKIERTINEAKFAKLPAMKNLDEGQKEAAELKVKAPRKKYKEMLDKLQQKYFAISEEQMLSDLNVTARQAQTLATLVAEFDENFTAAKTKKRLVDFADLEHFALKILSDGEDESGALKPSPVAEEMRERFVAVMVDEYQDTNGVQEAIINLVTNNKKPNLFCVGDVKQSIYRFRLADPSLFLTKYRTYPQTPDKTVVIDLKQNFRSRAGVLAAINFVFAQLMSPEAMEIDYDAAARLYPGADYPPRANDNEPETELTVILPTKDDDDTAKAEDGASGENPAGLELEGIYIARRLKKMHDEGREIFDKNLKRYRPIEWRDMVILLRSVKGKGEILLEILRQNDVPAYVTADAGFFAEQEIKVMLSLLEIIDNARQDIHLAAVLSSPIGGFDFNDLARLRINSPTGDLYDALCAAQDMDGTVLAAKAAGFLSRLASWRIFAREKSVPELIQDLYTETGYYDYVGGQKGGTLRQANLRVLTERAAEYEKTDFRGLFRFLRFVERMRDMDTDLAVARTLGESENVVRIMSIHKSKGLEFPVVVMADLGKKFNLQDTRADVLVHRELGVGLYYVDEELNERIPTLARKAIAARLLQESKAEELRVLYVGMTRAREKLIMVGTLNGNHGKYRADLLRYVGRSTVRVPPYRVLWANSFLDWLLLTVAHHPDGAVIIGDDPPGFADYVDSSRWQVELCSSAAIKPPQLDINGDVKGELTEILRQEKTLPSTPNRDEVNRLLSWRYDMAGLDEVSAKLSVTEIKRRQAEAEKENAGTGTLGLALGANEVIQSSGANAADAPWPRPGFYQASESPTSIKLTATEYGTLMHTVMQHVDFGGDMSSAGLKAQLAFMVEREVILPAEAKLINLAHVGNFFRSPLGERLQSADEVWREIPFSRLLPAKQFFPQVRGDKEQVFVQGIIDLLFAEGDDLVLVDYKTDRHATPQTMRERYRVQIDLYAAACTALLRRNVKECYLYMLTDGTIVPMHK